MEILDPGHTYLMNNVDDVQKKFQILRFVKRTGKNYPGNENSQPGIILQSVLRVCSDRVKFLQSQKWCLENILIVFFLKLILWLLEFRAARIHKYFYFHSLNYAELKPMCKICGHTFCEKIMYNHG